MKFIAPLFLCYLSFICFALSMWRERQSLLPEHSEISRKLFWAFRVTAWLALAISLSLSIQYYGTAVGITLWTGLMTLSGVAVSMLTVYRPRLALALLSGLAFPLVATPIVSLAVHILTPIVLFILINLMPLHRLKVL